MQEKSILISFYRTLSSQITDEQLSLPLLALGTSDAQRPGMKPTAEALVTKISRTCGDQTLMVKAMSL